MQKVPVQALSCQKILKIIQKTVNPRLKNCKYNLKCIVFQTLPSTQDWLIQNSDAYNLSIIPVCLAEHQTQARGQRENQWVAPATGNIYLSMRLPKKNCVLHHSAYPLSVRLGQILIHWLSNIFPEVRFQLKSPNDLGVIENNQFKKIGGILIESSRSRAGHANHPQDSQDSQDAQEYWIIGIGLNIFLSAADLNNPLDISQPWSSLRLAGISVERLNRNNLIADMLEKILESLMILDKFYKTIPFTRTVNLSDFRVQNSSGWIELIDMRSPGWMRYLEMGQTDDSVIKFTQIYWIQDTEQAYRVFLTKQVPSHTIAVLPFVQELDLFFEIAKPVNFQCQNNPEYIIQTINHFCQSDRYIGTLKKRAGQIELNWSVRGPHKNYCSQTVVTLS